MRLQILDGARDDLIEGFHFYEDMEAGLGECFLTNLYSDIEALKELDGTLSKPYRHFHRALSKRFSFAIFYTVDNNTVGIRAVVDCRRNPSWIGKHSRSN